MGGGTKQLLLSIELRALREYLQRSAESAAEGAARVAEIYREGVEFHPEDEENAYFELNRSAQFALRAVYYELAALIETEVQQAAEPIWRASKKHKGPKCIQELGPDWQKGLPSLRMVWDRPYQQLVELVEGDHDIRLANLEGASAVRKVRETVNSFRHRRGLKEFRKRVPPSLQFPGHYELKFDEVRDSIREVGKFIVALRRATKTARRRSQNR